MFSLFAHGERLRPIVEEVEQMITGRHQEIAALVDYNQLKVLRSFQKHEVNEFHFAPSTGYGYDDSGRAALESIYADVFGGEDALVRPHIISGTHAIAISLFGLLRPGDDLLYITGKPYDTLEEVVGVRGEGQGSLREYGIGYQYVPLAPTGEIDFPAVAAAITPKTKVIGIQRSRGYADRPSFTIAKLKEMIQFVKEINPELIVFVDNCYGEFTEELEPLQVGADIMAGSLIKNPGGGLVKTAWLYRRQEGIGQESFLPHGGPRDWSRRRGIAVLPAGNVPRLLPRAARGRRGVEGRGLFLGFA